LLTIAKKYIPASKKTFFQLFNVLGDQGLSSLTSFVTGMVLTRACSKQDFGIYVLAMSIIFTVLGFQRALISTPYTICRCDFNENIQKRYLRTIFLFRTFLTVVVVAGSSVFLLCKMLGSQNADWKLLIVFLFALSGHTFYFFLKDTLLAQLKVGLNLAMGIAINSCILICLLGFYFGGKLNLGIYFGILAAVTIICTNVVRYFLRIQKIPKSSMRHIRFFLATNWKTGKWITSTNLLFSIVSQMYPWLLALYFGSKEVALFGVATGATRFFNPVLQGLNAYFLPKLSSLRDQKERFTNSLIGLGVFMFCMAVILVITGYFWGEQIISLIYSSKYEGLGNIAFLAFCDQALQIAALPIDISLNALKRTDIGFQSVIIRVIIMVLLGIFLCLNFSVEGAIIAIIAEKIAAYIFCLVFLARNWRKI